MIAMPDKVKALLDASVRRVRRIYLLRGIAATLAAAIAATLAAMSVDSCFTLYSDAARWLLSAALYACVLAAAWLFLARPLSRRLDARRMAKILDARHPEHEECLTTLVELVDSAARGDGRPGFSEDLVGILSAKAAAAAAAVDAEREFTSRTIIRRLKALGAIALLLLLSFVLAPHLAGRLFVRAVAPWVDVGNLYSGDIAVKPGDVVALAGTVVRIEAAVADGLHYAPSIRISRRTALGWGEEFADEMKDGVYEAIADLSEPEWRYRVSAGPAVTRHYTVRVCEMPRYESFSARIDYPAYTGRSPSVVSNDDVSALEAVEGSRVSFALDLGGRAVKASLRVDGRPADAHEMVSNRVSSWTLDLVGEEGFAAPRRGGQLRSFLDTPPTVVVERPAAKTLRLAPYVKFPLAVSASDDIGVAGAVLRWRADGGGWPLAWRICQYARLLDGDLVGRAVRKIIGGAADSFLNGRRIFQIDGNLGAVAGIAEALLQSHTGLIHLLPALPPGWTEGSVSGLMARGGVRVDIRWQGGRLAEAVLRPSRGGELELRTDVPVAVSVDGVPVPADATPWGLRFPVEAGRTYTLACRPEA